MPRLLHRFPLAFALFAILTAATVGLPHGAAAAQREGDRIETIRIPVLKRPVSRDDLIGAGDIDWVETSLRRMPQTALTEADSLIGMAAQRRLQPGRAILARDVAPPLAVRKGDLVAIVYTTPFMTLTARGRALEDAAAGATIRALNNHSKRTVQATAIAPGIVATRPLSHAELAEALR